MTFDTERRDFDRHRPMDHRASLRLSIEWTADQIQVRGARVINVSSTGALIVADRPRIPDRPLRVLFEGAPELGWISAVPVRFGESDEVGIRFSRPFPLDFLPKSDHAGDYPAVILTEGQS